jgi:predicted nucleic acid-binding protein
MIRRVLVDTGPLVAIVSEVDQDHNRCVEQLTQIIPPLLTCWPVITEAAWLLRDQPKEWERLVGGFETGLLKLLPLDEICFPSVLAIMRRYRKLGAQLADACLLELADREDTDLVFTLDRPDFTVYRLPDGRALRLLPE